MRASSKRRVVILLGGVSIFMLICAFISTAAFNFMEIQIRNEIADAVGAVESAAPDLLPMFMHSYKHGTAEQVFTGRQILEQYGYGCDVYSFLPNQDLFFLFFLCLGMMAVLTLVAWSYNLNKKRNIQKRVDELTSYLNRVMSGRYDTLLHSKEDVFSPLEDSIYKSVVLLREEREQAQQGKKNLSDNLANLSHQLKTPIASMQLTSDSIKKQTQDEQTVTYTLQLEKQLDHFQRLVRSLLTLSKLDAGTLPLEYQVFDVEEMLIDAIQPFVQQFEEKQIQFSIDGVGDVEFIGDFGWCSEAVGNIIKNCLEHTPVNGNICITYQDNPIYMEIVAQDSGCGIVQSEIPHIFERFYCGKNAAKDSVGIGLALSKSIIEQENGTIIAENAETGGARFRMKFYHCH